MSYYGKREYWDERYDASLDHYDWYQTYHGIRHLLSPYQLSASQGLDPNKPRRILEQRNTPVSHSTKPKLSTPPRDRCRILIVGCGNSRLAEEMVRDGWTGGIVCADWSSVVIQQMSRIYNDRYLEELEWNYPKMSKRDRKLIEFVCVDICDGGEMSKLFTPESFDLIICKGTLDSILSGAGSVFDVEKMMVECYKYLVGNGSMVVISHANAEARIKFFESGSTNVVWDSVGIHTLSRYSSSDRRQLLDRDAPKYHYAYISRKQAGNTLKTVEEDNKQDVTSVQVELSKSDEENVAV